MPVIVYTQPGCQPCKSVVRKLTLEAIPFETIDITTDAAAAEMLRKAGFTGTPVLHHDGELHTIAGLVGIVTAHRELDE